jgi:hypothetical protein
VGCFNLSRCICSPTRPFLLGGARQQRLHVVREVGDGRIAHDTGHALDRVHRAKDRVERLTVAGISLEPEQCLVDRDYVVAALGQEQLGVAFVHRIRYS